MSNLGSVPRSYTQQEQYPKHQKQNTGSNPQFLHGHHRLQLPPNSNTQRTYHTQPQHCTQKHHERGMVLRRKCYDSKLGLITQLCKRYKTECSHESTAGSRVFYIAIIIIVDQDSYYPEQYEQQACYKTLELAVLS